MHNLFNLWRQRLRQTAGPNQKADKIELTRLAALQQRKRYQFLNSIGANWHTVAAWFGKAAINFSVFEGPEIIFDTVSYMKTVPRNEAHAIFDKMWNQMSSGWFKLEVLQVIRRRRRSVLKSLASRG